MNTWFDVVGWIQFAPHIVLHSLHSMLNNNVWLKTDMFQKTLLKSIWNLSPVHSRILRIFSRKPSDSPNQKYVYNETRNQYLMMFHIIFIFE